MSENNLCGDCPPVGYPTDKTRCRSCPRRTSAEEETIDGRPVNRTGRLTMSEPHELEERAEHAWSAERQKWLISGDGERVFSLDDAGIDDPPRFTGLRSECEQFVRSHCIRAVLALVKAEQFNSEFSSSKMCDEIEAWWLSHTAKEK